MFYRKFIAFSVICLLSSHSMQGIQKEERDRIRQGRDLRNSAVYQASGGEKPLSAEDMRKVNSIANLAPEMLFSRAYGAQKAIDVAELSRLFDRYSKQLDTLSENNLNADARSAIGKARDNVTKAYRALGGVLPSQSQQSTEATLDPEDRDRLKKILTLGAADLFSRATTTAEIEKASAKYKNQIKRMEKASLGSNDKELINQAMRHLELTGASVTQSYAQLADEEKAFLSTVLSTSQGDLQAAIAQPSKNDRLIKAMKSYQELLKGDIKKALGKELNPADLTLIQQAVEKYTNAQTEETQEFMDAKIGWLQGFISPFYTDIEHLHTSLQNPAKRAAFEQEMRYYQDLVDGTITTKNMDYKNEIIKLFAQALKKYKEALKDLTLTEYDEAYSLSFDAQFKRFNDLIAQAGIAPIMRKEQKAINDAFKQASLLLHPDKLRDNKRFNEAQKQTALKIYKELVASREALLTDLQS